MTTYRHDRSSERGDTFLYSLADDGTPDGIAAVIAAETRYPGFVCYGDSCTIAVSRPPLALPEPEPEPDYTGSYRSRYGDVYTVWGCGEEPFPYALLNDSNGQTVPSWASSHHIREEIERGWLHLDDSLADLDAEMLVGDLYTLSRFLERAKRAVWDVLLMCRRCGRFNPGTPNYSLERALAHVADAEMALSPDNPAPRVDDIQDTLDAAWDCAKSAEQEIYAAWNRSY